MSYYIYVYMDPRKPNNFKYSGIKFSHEPFYIVKGKNKRKDMHLYKCLLSTISRKTNKIKAIIKCGMEPIIQVLFDNLADKEALKLEKKLIKKIGRLDLGKGSLCNHTNGGDGAAGRPFKSWNKTSRNRLSLALKGRVLSKEHKRRISASLLGNRNGKGLVLGFKHTLDSRRKMSLSRIGKSLSDSHKLAILSGRRKYFDKRKASFRIL